MIGRRDMRLLTLSFVAASVLLNCGCRSPLGHHFGDSTRRQIEMVVLAHMVANGDQNASLIRFVELTPTDLERLRNSCGSRFEIFSTAKAVRSGRVLYLEDTNREGMRLSTAITKIRGHDAEARGSYLHLDGFADFIYKLHYDEGGWRIVSCEFYCAS